MCEGGGGGPLCCLRVHLLCDMQMNDQSWQPAAPSACLRGDKSKHVLKETELKYDISCKGGPSPPVK